MGISGTILQDLGVSRKSRTISSKSTIYLISQVESGKTFEENPCFFIWCCRCPGSSVIWRVSISTFQAIDFWQTWILTCMTFQEIHHFEATFEKVRGLDFFGILCGALQNKSEMHPIWSSLVHGRQNLIYNNLQKETSPEKPLFQKLLYAEFLVSRTDCFVFQYSKIPCKIPENTLLAKSSLEVELRHGAALFGSGIVWRGRSTAIFFVLLANNFCWCLQGGSWNSCNTFKLKTWVFHQLFCRFLDIFT